MQQCLKGPLHRLALRLLFVVLDCFPPRVAAMAQPGPHAVSRASHVPETYKCSLNVCSIKNPLGAGTVKPGGIVVIPGRKDFYRKDSYNSAVLKQFSEFTQIFF